MEPKQEQTMYLLDLPADLSPGRVPLKPENAFCSRLTPCDGCKGHSAKAIQAACGHAYCKRCAIISPPDPAGSGDLQMWCSVCQIKQEADPLPEIKVLDRMKFSCRCGAEGSLREIKKHFWVEPVRGGHRPVSTDEEPQPQAKEAAQPQVAVDPEHDNSVNAVGEHIESVGQKLQELREQMKSISNGVTGLECSAGHHGQGVFWVPVKKLIDEYRRDKSNVYSALYKWRANGNLIATQFMILDKGGEAFFGVVHRAAMSATNVPYKPYRMLIGAKVLDIFGVTVETGITATYEGFLPTKAFKEPLPDHVSGGTGPYLISVEALTHPGAKIITPGGLANVTVECLPPII